MVVVGIRQGATVALTAMQLRTKVNLHRVVPRFPEHVRPGERVELVNDIATTADAIIADVDVEEILHGGG